jgi:hypothetical protein
MRLLPHGTQEVNMAFARFAEYMTVRASQRVIEGLRG